LGYNSTENAESIDVCSSELINKISLQIYLLSIPFSRHCSLSCLFNKWLALTRASYFATVLFSRIHSSTDSAKIWLPPPVMMSMLRVQGYSFIAESIQIENDSSSLAWSLLYLEYSHVNQCCMNEKTHAVSVMIWRTCTSTLLAQLQHDTAF
jgi:hypothetical protein